MDNKFLTNASTVCDKGPTIAATLFSFKRLCYQDDGEMIMSHEYIQNEEGGGGGMGPI